MTLLIVMLVLVLLVIIAAFVVGGDFPERRYASDGRFNKLTEFLSSEADAEDRDAAAAPQSPLDMPAGKYNCQKKILKNTVIVTLIVFLSGYIIYALYKWCDLVDQAREDRADRALSEVTPGGDSKSSPQTNRTLRERAEQGEANAQYLVGLFCENEDFAQTIYWWRKAAEQGHRTAQRKLGESYYYGRGVEVDRQQAEYWFSKAAKQGEPGSEFMLKMYFNRR